MWILQLYNNIWTTIFVLSVPTHKAGLGDGQLFEHSASPSPVKVYLQDISTPIPL